MSSPSIRLPKAPISRRSMLFFAGAGVVSLAALSLADAHQYAAFAAETVPIGTPLVISNPGTALVVDVSGGASSDGAAIIVWNASGAANQDWIFSEPVDGWSTITSARSGKVLDAYGGGLHDGATVIQWTASGGPNQLWKLESVEGGRRIVNKASGRVLTIVGDSTAAGAALEIRTDAGLRGQRWALPSDYVGGYTLDASVVEARTDDPIPGFGGVAAGVTYGVTRNGWLRDGEAWYPRSGEFHYVRYAPDRWEHELGKMRAAGLDTVATYVFWNHHEAPEGTWDWSGRRDIRRFIEAAQRQGLYVWLRPGPYINAEATHGGIPDFALSGKRSNDPTYLAKVDRYFTALSTQLQGLFVADGGPIVGVQLENEFASGDPAHITKLREMCTNLGLVAPYFTVTANSRFSENTALPLQGAYCYRGWVSGAETGPVSGFVYGTDEWTANTDIGGAYYDTLRYPRGHCELGTGSPMNGDNRFIVERKHVIAHAYDSVGRGGNYLGYYMFHGGTQVPGMSDGWSLTYDFQAPLGEFGRRSPTYPYYRRLHTFVETFADELVPTRVSRDPLQIMNPSQQQRLRYVGRFDAEGRGFVFVNNTQRNVALAERDDVQIAISGPRGAITLPAEPLTMPVDRSTFFPVMTDLSGVDLRWATVEPFAKITSGDLPTWVYWAPDWTNRTFAFGTDVQVTDELGTTERSQADDELLVEVPADRRTSLLVSAPGAATPNARVIVLTEAESLSTVVLELDGKKRLVVGTDLVLSGVAPEVRFEGEPGTQGLVDVYPSTGLAPGVGWQNGTAAAPFARRTHQFAAGGAEPTVTPDGTRRWRIAIDAAELAVLSDGRLEMDYRGSEAKVIVAGAILTEDLYHGAPLSLDLKYFDSAQLADLVVEITPWRDGVRGVPKPSGTESGLAGWQWQPNREAVWGGEPAAALAFDAAAEPRRIGSKAYVSVKATNRESVPVSFAFVSAFGEKSFVDVAPGANATHSFAVRAATVAAGAVTVTASATVGGSAVTTTSTVQYSSLG